jgi:hypothetical protein
MVQTHPEEVKKFIYNRVLNHPKFKAVIAVSVEKYPSEFSATVWVGQEPDPEMRQYAYELETEFENLGIACSIIVKADRELPFGGRYGLRTKRGEFSYRYYRIDPVKDEDMVYVFALYQGTRAYRFRVSLSRTLASMLRNRNRLNEDRVLEVYLDWIRQRIEAGDVEAEIEEHMFDSRRVALFVGN